ncbi:MAG: DUF4249 family protein [Candidatus Latescibacterota bacterium]
MARWIGMFCFLFLLACAADREPGELFGPSSGGMLVIDALLVVDHPLPDVFVHETVAPGTPYSREMAAVLGAEVAICQGEQVFGYQADPDSLGRYLPAGDFASVMPGTDYQLTVLSEGREARATTRTPGRFHITETVLLDEESLAVRRSLRGFPGDADSVFAAPENQVTYLDGLLEARFAPTDVPAFQAGFFSLDLDSDPVIEADFLREEDYENLERQGSSPPLEGRDGVLRMPWLMISFAGRHLIRIYALDDNWFDYIRSSQGGGFGEEAGGSFERPLFHVAGGIGLFGSASVDSLGFVVLPKEPAP